jgi:outer membrane lipoprotein-sorting protein
VYILELENDDIFGRNLLREYEMLVLTLFQGIPTDNSLAKLEHSETLKVGKDKKDCYVLTTQTPGREEKHTIWVDKTEFTIWKSVDKKKSFDTDLSGMYDRGVSLYTTVTMTTKQLSLNPSFDENDFVFTPPDHAKRVDSLKLSGNPF